MATWPPSPNPWPPPELGPCQFSDFASFQTELSANGFMWRNPTNSENNQYFKGLTCDEGHPVSGVMIYHPSAPNRVYPFWYCNAASHRELGSLWPPYYMGYGSGV